MSGYVDICIKTCQVIITLSHANLIGMPMIKKFCGPLKPLSWIAIAVAIAAASMSGAEALELAQIDWSTQ
jgi:hypothetical protein